MRVLLISVMFLFVTGCTYWASVADTKMAEQFCTEHGGWKSIKMKAPGCGDGEIIVECQSGHIGRVSYRDHIK